MSLEQANHAIELSRLKKHHISTHFYDLVTGLPNENHWYNPARHDPFGYDRCHSQKLII